MVPVAVRAKSEREVNTENAEVKTFHGGKSTRSGLSTCAASGTTQIRGYVPGGS